jgi:hypothetical protein
MTLCSPANAPAARTFGSDRALHFASFLEAGQYALTSSLAICNARAFVFSVRIAKYRLAGRQGAWVTTGIIVRLVNPVFPDICVLCAPTSRRMNTTLTESVSGAYRERLLRQAFIYEIHFQ